MKPYYRGARSGMFALVVMAVAAALAAPQAQSQAFSVVHSFSGGADGSNPLAGLVLGGSGNLYGTTMEGGEFGSGTVFELNSSGQESVLYSFVGAADGAQPIASLIAMGNALYGTTSGGGAYGNGVVFEMTFGGKETVLYSFKGGTTDGAAPGAALTRDAAGNLYSTTNAGGAHGNGTVFKLVHPAPGSTTWTEQVLYSFGAITDDGANPVSGVSLDSAGNLYGTTSDEGQYSYGTIYELSPSGSSWTETILHQFELLSDGGTPYAGIVVDHLGNLWGGTTDGGQGGSNGGGTIFEMTKTNGVWTFKVIYSLPGWGISGSFRNILVAAENRIFATTHCDGNNTAGTVFQLTEAGGVWNYKSLYVFTGGTDGLYSFSNPVLFKGSLYGTTKLGGEFGDGVIFKVQIN